MKQELTKEDIYFLARVKKIEVEHLLKMQSMLDPKKVRATLIRYEFKERAKVRRIAKRDIITLLMNRYSVSRSYIEAIIYQKAKRSKCKECLNCGVEISYYIWSKNDGFCKSCLKGDTMI